MHRCGLDPRILQGCVCVISLVGSSSDSDHYYCVLGILTGGVWGGLGGGVEGQLLQQRHHLLSSIRVYSDDGSFTPGVGNLWPTGQIWPITSLGKVSTEHSSAWLLTVCLGLLASQTELSICDGDHTAHKAEHIYSLAQGSPEKQNQ